MLAVTGSGHIEIIVSGFRIITFLLSNLSPICRYFAMLDVDEGRRSMIFGNTLRVFCCRLILAASVICAGSSTGAVWHDGNAAFAGEHEDRALAELRKFLFDASARKGFAAQDLAAGRAESDLSSYSPQIQQELLEIVSIIMTESKGNPGAASLNAVNPAGAMQSFSPAVQARIQAVARKIAAQQKK